MDHFMTALGLDMSYSLVVLNPTWHVDEPVYGYRLGISSAELQAIKGSTPRLRRVMVGGAARTPAGRDSEGRGTGGPGAKRTEGEEVLK